MIFSPLKYLTISHEQKAWYDLWLPLIVGLIFAGLVFALKIDLAFVGADGLIRQTNGLLGVLAGFYIAALAAVSTFPSPAIDEKMDGDPPTLKIKENGKTYNKKLTRREYLRYLFGYLALMSILVFFGGIFLDTFYAPILNAFSSAKGEIQYLSSLIAVFYIMVMANLMFNTLVGVYYLADRIHQPSSKTDTVVEPPDEGTEPEEFTT